MKKIILIALFFPIIMTAQKTEWAKTITGNSSKVSKDHKVCTDKENNFYIMANFTDKILFGSDIVLKSKNVTGPTDAFVAKIDPKGEIVRWGIQITGFGNIEAKNICTDTDMNLYVVGSFEDKTGFDENNFIQPKVKTGFFIAKYDKEGNFIWVRHGGNYYSQFPGTSYANSVKTDNEGNIIVIANVLGMYDEWKHDPNLPIEEQYLGKSYYEDEEISGKTFYTGNHNIILKLTPEGKLVWKKVLPMNVYYNDVAIDANNNLYMTGCISGTTNINGEEITAGGLRDIAITKFNSNGDIQWLKKYGCEGIVYNNLPVDLETGNFISIDKNNNVYFAGIHYDGARFDDLTLNTEAKLGGLKVGNIFLAKLNTEGKIEWVKNAESKKSASAVLGLVSDSEGNTYMSAVIGLKKVFFDGKKANGPFLAKFDTNGEVVWINDADKSDFWSSTKVSVNIPGGLAISEDNSFLYATGNATKKTSDSNYLTGTTTTTTESIVAISKVKTGN